ncbi:hypothetical protein, partial [Pseudoalteromonas sp. G24-MNA-CIBAN-0072]|uniref:hypothetical protein n=1 Tax=Pseudoalteromonas sp. G24-MNA-CIBAN-0072 TaxID=3140418 RepID=UPI00331E7BB9
GFGLWALGFGLWALGFGLWALGFGLWALQKSISLCICICICKGFSYTYFIILFFALRFVTLNPNFGAIIYLLLKAESFKLIAFLNAKKTPAKAGVSYKTDLIKN